MASKVNVKFVVILAVVLVVIAGAVGWVGWTVVTKTGEELEAMGDAAAAEGDWANARLYYSKAVNRDKMNVPRLKKWLESVEQWEPPTETAFQDGYRGRYMLVHQALATAQPLDVEAQMSFVSLLNEQQSLAGYSRTSAEMMIERINDVAEEFEDSMSPPEGWQTLLRFRGFSRAEVYLNGGVISDEEIELAMSDLRAAIAADPDDGEALSAIVRIMTRKSLEALRNDRFSQAEESLEAAQREVTEFMSTSPGNPWAAVYQSMTEFELARLRETRDLLPDEAAAVVREMLPTFRPQLQRSVDALAAAEMPLDSRLISILGGLERAVTPDSRLSQTIGLAEASLEASADNDLLMLFTADLNKQSGNRERALELLERASGMPNLPMSLEGFIRYSTRRRALIERVEIQLTRVVESSDMEEAERTALLAEADTLREEYADQVSTDEPQLDFVDGLRAIADDNMNEALRLMTRYNEQMGNAQPGGLWWQAQVALRTNQEGVAERALARLVELQPANLAAVALLGEAKLALQKPEEAMEAFERVLEANPNNEQIQERLNITRQLLDPEEADDPVDRVMLLARKLRFGDEETAGDPAGANRILAEGLEANAGDERIALELILAHLDEDNIDGARATAAVARNLNPDSESMRRLALALERESATDVFVSLIDQSERAEIDKLMSKHNIYARAGMVEEAQQILAQAREVDPDDPRAFEAEFMSRLARDELDGLDAMVTRSGELNIDQMNGLTFRARLLAARGDLTGAIESMQQAIARGAAPSAAYRMLANQQRVAGRTVDAITTLENALEANPDDLRTIREYIGTLDAAGRTQDALGAARRMEVYGRTDPVFVDAWLSLEAAVGGRAGRELAVTRREQMLESLPTNNLNKLRLASLYIEDRRWDDAKTLIDDLAAEDYNIGVVGLLAQWYADQGRVEVDGQQRNGLELARAAFTDYIVSIPQEEMTIAPWLNMAAFLADRGDIDTAARALVEARGLQSPEIFEADKMLGDLMLTRARYSTAKEAYQRIVDAGVDDASQTYLQRLIETNLRLGQFEEGQQNLERLNEPAASSLTAMLQRADATRGLGDTPGALELIDRAIAEYPEDPLPLTLRARAIIASGGLASDALADLDRALQLDGQFTRARRTRAGVYFDQGRTDDALRDFRTIIRQDPTQSDVAYAMINELNRLGRDREAITVANEIVEARPQDIGLAVNMASIFITHERHARAAELYQIAWERSRNPTIAARLIGTMIRVEPPQVRDAARVVEELKGVVQGSEENPAITAIDAIVAEARGDHAEALEFMTEAFGQAGQEPGMLLGWNANVSEVFREREPEEAVAFMRRVRRGDHGEIASRWLDFLIAQRLADIDDTYEEGVRALASLRESNTEDPVAMVTYSVEGGARYAADDFEGAERVWNEGLEQFPNNWEIANNLAYMIATELDDPNRALPLAERAVQAGQTQASAYDTLGKIYLMLDKLDEARESFETAMRLAQNTRTRAEIMLNQARLQRKLGNDDVAREMLSSVRELARSLDDDQTRIEAEIDELMGQIGSADG